MWRTQAVLIAFVLALGGAGRNAAAQQQAPDNIEKKLDAMMKRLEQQDKTIQGQNERLKKQEEMIESLKKPGASSGGVDTLSPKQEKQVEQLVGQYLGKEENRLSLGLDGVTGGYKDGFFLASRDQAYKMKFTGYVQLDARVPDTPTADTFLVRRARPTVEGTLAKYYNFKIQPDFGEGKVVLKDAFLELAYFGDLSTTRLGKFKVPQNFEQLTSSSDIPFVERSLVTNIVPDRDVGVMMYGKPFEGIAEYMVALYNGNDRAEWSDKGKDSDQDNNDPFDFGARLQIAPFKKTKNPWLKGIQGGGWVNVGQEQDAYKLNAGKSVLSYKTGPGTTFFKTYAGSSTVYAVRQDGLRTRAGYDAAWLVGPVKLTHDWVIMNSELMRQDVAGGPFIRADLPVTAWQIGATWLLTGEDATHKNPKPKKDFDPKKGGWGAFELAARYSHLQWNNKIFDGPVSSTRQGFAAAGVTDEAGEITLGLNWYLNPLVKLMFDWTHTAFDRGIDVAPPSTVGATQNNIQDEDAFMFRSQIKW